MSPGRPRPRVARVRFPRVSGDEPVAKGVPLPKDAFSPRERG